MGDVIVENLGGTVFDPGDGTGTIGSSLGPLLYLVTAIDIPNDWLFGEAIDPTSLPDSMPPYDTDVSHTYPMTGNFTAFIDDCCRLGVTATNAHINNADGSYRVETRVNVGTGNSPPDSTMPPIVLCPINGICAFNVPAVDPDMDTITYRLSTSAEASGTPPGFVQPGPPNAPNAASINPTTGLYSWNTTGATLGAGTANTIYSTQVTIEDRDGSNNVKSKIAVDFLIQLVAQAGVPPVFDHPPTPTCGSTINATVGSNVSFTVQASDTDFGQTVTLNGLGIPSGATMTPPLPTTADPVSSVFNWTPTGAQTGLQVITFSATDSANLQSMCTVTIDVAALPSPTATRTQTSTRTATPTSTATATDTATSTVTATNTVAPTDTATPTPSNTLTPTRTDTATATATGTPLATNTQTATRTDTATATATGTPPATNTQTATRTTTATPTVTSTPTASVTPSATSTPSMTPTPSFTRTPIQVDDTLVLSYIKLRHDNSDTRENGKAVIRALVDDNDTSGGLETSLLAGTVVMRVLDSNVFDVTFTFTNCSVKVPTLKIVCRSLDRSVKGIFKPTLQGPFVYNMVAVVKHLPVMITGVSLPVGPLAYVLMDQGGHPRSDEIGNVHPCEPGRGRELKCRERRRP